MKKNFNRYTLLITCLIFFSCSRILHPGEYVKSVENASYEAFKIKSDSSFEYVYRSGWNKGNSTGKWSLQGNTLILNSQYKRDVLPLDVNSIFKESKNMYLFRFKKYYSQKNNPNIWQKLIINDRDTFRVEDSVMKINYNQELKTFKVEIITTEYLNDSIGMYKLTTQNYVVHPKKENEFTLSYPFNWDMSYYRDFKDEKLLIRHKSLVWSANQKEYKRRDK